MPSDRDKELSVSEQEARVGLIGFRYIMEQWHCTVEEQQQLLSLDADTFQVLQSQASPEMPDDVLMRISYLMGIYRALNTLYPTEERAVGRIRLPTTDEPFCGQSALNFMLTHSLEGIALTRRYFDWLAQA
ncbi:DUF2384 domain-containing protein [uncultured Marinobacter sp.]|uniref:DUF2384 domain-containing protein n=1 Tax=uncultured Marinobacter sp. TaxID=187379 RepID=UPI0030DAF5EE